MRQIRGEKNATKKAAKIEDKKDSTKTHKNIRKKT